MSRAVLFYESDDDVMSKAPDVYPAHVERVEEFRARGDLLLVGTFADVQADGSMAVFTTTAAAEEFARDDPFVREGVVRHWRVKEWLEVTGNV